MQCGELDNDRDLKESHCALFLLSWLFVSSCLFCCVCFSIFVHCVLCACERGLYYVALDKANLCLKWQLEVMVLRWPYRFVKLISGTAFIPGDCLSRFSKSQRAYCIKKFLPHRKPQPQAFGYVGLYIPEYTSFPMSLASQETSKKTD